MQQVIGGLRTVRHRYCGFAALSRRRQAGAKQPSQIDAQAMPLFASYRDVPWLARSYAVTMLRHKLASTATHGSVQQSFHLPPTLLLKSCSQRNFEVVQSIRSVGQVQVTGQHHD
jgi:hypothetical protein